VPDDRERRTQGARELLSGLRARQGPRARRPDRLDTPVDLRRPILGRGYDAERLGRASERVARFLGTGRFIVYMTIFVGGWLAWNWLTPVRYQFDPRALNFTLLTLLLSLQASYAAPLILLAQNRQDDRDRVNLDADRRNEAQLRADLDFVSREVASLRLAVGEVATRDYVRSELRQLTETLAELLGVDAEAEAAQAEAAKRTAKKNAKAERVERARHAARTAARAGEEPVAPRRPPGATSVAAAKKQAGRAVVSEELVDRVRPEQPGRERTPGEPGVGAGLAAGAPGRADVADDVSDVVGDEAVVGGRR